jgi:quinol monooxygenase YgiN
MIQVVAIVTAKPGQRASILDAFHANVPAVMQEPGVVQYVAVIDCEDGLSFQTNWGSDTFAVIEQWEDIAALRAHAATPHMAAYGAKVKELIATRTVHVLAPLAAI